MAKYLIGGAANQKQTPVRNILGQNVPKVKKEVRAANLIANRSLDIGTLPDEKAYFTIPAEKSETTDGGQNTLSKTVITSDPLDDEMEGISGSRLGGTTNQQQRHKRN